MGHSPDESTSSQPRPALGAAGLIATGFGAGLLPKAPGTWGSLLALPFAYGVQVWGGDAWGAGGLGVASLLAFLVGIYVSNIYVKRTGRDDPGEVVIDEIAGQWLALVPAAADPVLFAVGFVLFRVFDIWKPWPVGWADRKVKGGLGIMLDDMFAGAYACAIVYGIRMWMGG